MTVRWGRVDSPPPMRIRENLGRVAVVALVTSVPASAPGQTEPAAIRGTMTCSRGPDPQYFEARAYVPASAPAGSIYTLRVDAATSPKISGVGLNYLHDMKTDYAIPDGTAYVAGSAHVVDQTGSDNVRPGARATYDNGVVRLTLPGHVENGSSFTPPGLEFQVKVVAPAGTSLPLRWVRHQVTANVFVIGNLDITCAPKAGALTLGTTMVTPPPS